MFLFPAIKDQPFYFMCGVFFCKTMEKEYIPAELAIAAFSCENGVERKFHTFVNPGTLAENALYDDKMLTYTYVVFLLLWLWFAGQLPLGNGWEARDHSAKSHRLEVPPNAMGETCYGKIRRDIINFITPKNNFNQSNATQNDLVVFTNEFNLPIVASILNQLSQADEEPSNINIEVFPLDQLFFAMKRKSEIGSPVPNITVANMLLEKDPFRNADGLACTVMQENYAFGSWCSNCALFVCLQFHEERDVSQYCCLSQVMRLCFVFADNICRGLQVPLVAGAHLPRNADVRPPIPPRRIVTDCIPPWVSVDITRDRSESVYECFICISLWTAVVTTESGNDVIVDAFISGHS